MADISNYSDNTLVSGTYGDDSIYSWSYYGTVEAGSGDDIINVRGHDNIINGGAGNDSITNGYGTYGNTYSTTITAGAGNDFVSLHSDSSGNLIKYASGDGYDTIRGFNADDTLQITSGTYTTTQSGTDIIVNVGSGSITVKDAPVNLNISGTYGTSDLGNNYDPGYITGNGSYSYISGTSGNDSIYPSGDAHSTVDAGAGNDTIYSLSDYLSVSGGAGNDSISLFSYDATINAGTGNDQVSIYSSAYSNNLIQYAYGDGYDTVVGMGTDDTLQITSGTYTTTQSGNDVVVNVGNYGSVTLKDVAGTNIKISGTQGRETITGNGSYSYISGTSEADYIRPFGDSYSTVSAGAGDDTIYSLSDYLSVSGGAGNDSINLYSYDATINAGTGNDAVSISSYATNNLIQYASGDGYDTVQGFNSDDTLQITSGTYTTTQSGNDVVVNVGSYGSVTLKDVAGTSVNIIGSQGRQSITGTGYYSYINGTSGGDFIYPSGDRYSTVDAGAGDDTIQTWSDDLSISGGAGNDSIYAYSYNATLNGGTGNDTIVIASAYATNNVVQYGNGDGYDTVQGFNSDDTLQITSGTYSTVASGNDVIVNVGEGSITLKDVATQTVHINGTPTATSVATVAAVNIEGDGNFTGVNIDGDNNIVGNGNTINIYYINIDKSDHSTTNITEVTNITNVTNNYVTFNGASSQIIDNFVTGRNSDSNVLYFSTSLTSLNRTSSYMTFNSGNGSFLQVNNSSSVDEAVQYTTDGTNISYAKVGRTNQSNSFTYEDGVNFYSGSSSTDVLNVTNYQSRNVWLDGMGFDNNIYDNINDINASSSTGNNTLAGNAGNNKISAGQGNDSLWGGLGTDSDTLIGGGNNTYFYGNNNGNDVVVNSVATDKVDLYDVSLTDIVTAEERGSDLYIGMQGGQSLVIQGQQGASNFILADRSAYNYNRESHVWTRTA